jgi:hypothetical protein
MQDAELESPDESSSGGLNSGMKPNPRLLRIIILGENADALPTPCAE